MRKANMGLGEAQRVQNVNTVGLGPGDLDLSASSKHRRVSVNRMYFELGQNAACTTTYKFTVFVNTFFAISVTVWLVFQRKSGVHHVVKRFGRVMGSGGNTRFSNTAQYKAFALSATF